MGIEVWTEKYRPKKLEDIVGHENIIERLKSFVESGELPHLLFSGPAGTGKTASAHSIARELFGKKWRDNFMELNASDKRGIDVIRNEVKDFARTRAIGDVPFKIILLDEADALTKEAQQALRRTMEDYTRTCRFILDCNFSSKIIDPIQSRCAVFRFKPVRDEAVKAYLNKIIGAEELEIEDKALEAICKIADGDVRKATNLLQSSASLGEKITEEDVYSIASYARPKEMKKVINLALDKKVKEAREKLIDLMLEHGFSGLDAIKQIQKNVWSLNIKDEKKIDLVDKIGEYEFRLVEGSDPYLQLEALLAQFAKA